MLISGLSAFPTSPAWFHPVHITHGETKQCKRLRGRLEWGKKASWCFISAENLLHSAWFVLLSQFLAVRDALLTQMLVLDVLRMRLSNQQSLWCVYEQLWQILLTPPLTVFNDIIWREVQLALWDMAGRNVLQILCSFILWEHFRAWTFFPLFYSRTVVESVLLLCVFASTFTASDKLLVGGFLTF